MAEIVALASKQVSCAILDFFSQKWPSRVLCVTGQPVRGRCRNPHCFVRVQVELGVAQGGLLLVRGRRGLRNSYYR